MSRKKITICNVCKLPIAKAGDCCATIDANGNWYNIEERSDGARHVCMDCGHSIALLYATAVGKVLTEDLDNE